MDLIIEELNKIIINAKKSGGRKYTKETIIQKIKLIKQLSKKYGKLIAILPKIEREIKINEFKELKEIALDSIIRNSKELSSKEILELESMSSEETEETIKQNMSNFNGKQASEIIPIFDGKAKHLETFLSMVAMVYDDLNVQGKNHLIKYVLAMKMNDRVRDILTIEQTPTTLDELKASLTKNFKFTKTANNIHFELKNTKQKGNVLNYKEKINSLIAELTIAQISELGENTNETSRSLIKKLNEKLALEIFQEGLYEQIRIAVIAAQPKTLSQAYEIASAQERSLHLSDTFKTLQINRNNNQNIEFRNNRNLRHKNSYRQNNHNNINNNRYNNRNRSDRNYNNSYNNNNNSRNFNNHVRYPNNTNSRHNTNNAHNRNNRNTYNNNNHSNQRNNNYNNNPNVRTINQQGNEETLETQNESPERENYRFTQ